MDGKGHDEFVALIYGSAIAQGFNELSAKLIAKVFVSAQPLTLKELVTQTGYSFTAVSTGMKFFVHAGMVKQTHKPGSKTHYFTMEKDLISLELKAMKAKYESFYLPAKEQLPTIIEKYTKDKSAQSKGELDIAKTVYKQVLSMEKSLKRYVDAMLKAKKEV